MRRALIVIASCFAWAGTAAAEPPPGGYQQQNVQYYDPNAPPPQAQPYGQPQPYGEPQPYGQEQVIVTEQQPAADPAYAQMAPADPAAAGRGLQYGATAFVPIWLGAIGDQVRPGLGLHGRVGWEVGHGLSFEGGVGIMWNPDHGIFYRGSLTNVFFTGGVRYAFLNPSALVPFVHGALQVNLWNSCYEDAFGFEVCGDYSDVTVGFNAGGGLIWEINYNAALELGLNASGTTEGVILDLRPGRDFWIYLSPFLGFTLYF